MKRTQDKVAVITGGARGLGLAAVERLCEEGARVLFTDVLEAEGLVQLERLKGLGITPILSVNHHFTSSLYYRDPDGNEVEITCDNMPTKAECSAFMASPKMAEAMQPPFFGSEFDAEELLHLKKRGALDREMAQIGLS